MTSSDKREVMALVMEFILSLAVLGLGGFLIYTGKGTEIAVAMITAVITFWFNRRQSEAAQKQAETLLSSSSKTQQSETKGDSNNV